MDMETQILTALVTAAGTVIISLIGFLSNKLAAYLDEKGIRETLGSKRYLVDIAVQAIEQVYKNEDGDKKLQRAKVEALKLMERNNIKINEDELNSFIEASVRAMNEGLGISKDEPIKIDVVDSPEL